MRDRTISAQNDGFKLSCDKVSVVSVSEIFASNSGTVNSKMCLSSNWYNFGRKNLNRKSLQNEVYCMKIIEAKACARLSRFQLNC